MITGVYATKLAERRTSYLWLVLISLMWSAPVLIVGLILFYFTDRIDLSYTFTALGFLLSFLLPILFEQRLARARPRSVVFLDYRRHDYGHAIFRGVDAVLDSSGRSWKLNREYVSGTSEAQLARQIAHRLREFADEDVDAVVVLPLWTDTAFWDGVAAAIANKLAIVVVDVAPPLSRFEEAGRVPPLSVGTDYSAGGTMLGDYIADFLENDQAARAIIAMGPDQYFAGRERSRQAVGTLAARGVIDRSRFIPITRWDFDDATVEEIVDAIVGFDGTTIVYAAYDGNVIKVRRRLREQGVEPSRFRLVGYDATEDELGRVDVFEYGDAAATIDVQPEQQGRTIGKMLIHLRLRPSVPLLARSRVLPRLLTIEEYEHRRALGEQWSTPVEERSTDEPGASAEDASPDDESASKDGDDA